MAVAGAVLREAPASCRLAGGETHSLWQGDQVWGPEAWGGGLYLGTSECGSGGLGRMLEDLKGSKKGGGGGGGR